MSKLAGKLSISLLLNIKFKIHFFVFIIFLSNFVTPFSKIFLLSNPQKKKPKYTNRKNQNIYPQETYINKTHENINPDLNTVFRFNKREIEYKKGMNITEKEFLKAMGVKNDEIEDFRYINRKLDEINQQKSKKKTLKKSINENLNKHLDINVLLKKNKTDSQRTSFEIFEWKLKNFNKKFAKFLKLKNLHKKSVFNQIKIKKKRNHKRSNNKNKIENFSNPFLSHNTQKNNNNKLKKILLGTIDKEFVTTDCQFVLPFVDSYNREVLDMYNYQLLKNKTLNKNNKVDVPGKNK